MMACVAPKNQKIELLARHSRIMNFASLNRAFMDYVRARMTSVSAFSVLTYLVSVCKVCVRKSVRM